MFVQSTVVDMFVISLNIYIMVEMLAKTLLDNKKKSSNQRYC